LQQLVIFSRINLYILTKLLIVETKPLVFVHLHL